MTTRSRAKSRRHRGEVAHLRARGLQHRRVAPIDVSVILNVTHGRPRVTLDDVARLACRVAACRVAVDRARLQGNGSSDRPG